MAYLSQKWTPGQKEGAEHVGLGERGAGGLCSVSSNGGTPAPAGNLVGAQPLELIQQDESP